MLTNKGELKLLDFGISKVTNATYTQTKSLGTLAYMAPETFDLGEISEETNLSDVEPLISNKVDVWAVGCIINEVFSKEKPWASLKNENHIIA